MVYTVTAYKLTVITQLNKYCSDTEFIEYYPTQEAATEAGEKITGEADNKKYIIEIAELLPLFGDFWEELKTVKI